LICPPQAQDALAAGAGTPVQNRFSDLEYFGQTLAGTVPIIRGIHSSASVSSSLPQAVLAKPLEQHEHCDITSQLLTRFGVSAGTVLRTYVATEPPPLPACHISRPTFCKDLARTLDEREVVAITGYPESGKTVAIAEFARHCPAECFWFAVPAQAPHTGDWYAMFCLALRQVLGVESMGPAELQKSVQQRAVERPLLMVIDDAHHIDDLDTLDFLRQAAESSGSRLWLVLVGTDDPQFQAAVRGRAVSCQRLPGLSADEASALYTALGGPLTRPQVRAVRWLRGLVDGHVGMLRLRHARIRQVQSRADLEHFLEETRTGLGHELESLRAACLEYLRQGLDPNEFELCRRLSISWHAFSKQLAQALWSIDRDLASFPAVWNVCTLGVLEGGQGTSYVLPEIYRSGLSQFADDSEKRRWHAAAADTLQRPQGRVLDASAFCDGIAHRLLSGDHSTGLREAASLLVIAQATGTLSLESFLLDRLTFWVGHIATDRRVSPAARLLWHTARLSALRRLGCDAKADDAANQAFDVFSGEAIVDDDFAVQMAAVGLLFHAADAGRPDRAVMAAERIDDEMLDLPEPPPIPWRPFLVLWAFLKSQQNPVSFVQSLLTEGACLQATADAAERLGYWQLVAHGIYFAVERDAQADPR
jgi:hypothetical protein